MSSPPPVPTKKSLWPWWMDPYSDNPIAFGVLFMILIVLMIGGLLLYRILFIHEPGAQPIGPPYFVIHGGLSSLLGLL